MEKGKNLQIRSIEALPGGFFRRTHYSSTKIEAGHLYLLKRSQPAPFWAQGPDGKGQALSAILYLMMRRRLSVGCHKSLA